MANLARLVQSSNLPVGVKSAVGQWMEDLRAGSGAAVRKAGAHGMAFVNTVREYGESGIVGSALGALHAHLPNGLDIPINGGTHDYVPIDGAVAAAGAALSIFMPMEPAAVDARHMGASANSIFWFRKVYGWRKTQITAAGGHVGGTFAGESSANDVDENPLVNRARKMFSAR